MAADERCRGQRQCRAQEGRAYRVEISSRREPSRLQLDLGVFSRRPCSSLLSGWPAAGRGSPACNRAEGGVWWFLRSRRVFTGRRDNLSRGDDPTAWADGGSGAKGKKRKKKKKIPAGY